MDIATLQKTLDEIAADYVRRLNLRVKAISDDGVTLSLPVAPEMVHGGGVLCGQTIMSAADTAMLVAMIAKLGGFKPMTTVQMQTSFLRPVPKDVASIKGVLVPRRGPDEGAYGSQSLGRRSTFP